MSQPVASRPGDPSPGRTHREMPARSMQSRPEISFAVPCLVDFLKGLRSTRHRHPSRRRRSRRRASDPTTTNRPPNRVDHETRVSMWDGSRARLSASSQLDYDFFLVQRSTSGGLRVSMLAQSGLVADTPSSGQTVAINGRRPTRENGKLKGAGSHPPRTSLAESLGSHSRPARCCLQADGRCRCLKPARDG